MSQGFGTVDAIPLKFKTVGQVSLEEARQIQIIFTGVFQRLAARGLAYKVPTQITIYGYDFEGELTSYRVEGSTWSAQVQKGATVQNIESLIMSQGVQ